ncbi:MAG: 3-isopropylmalate dehydratase small subunit [Desulfohalobiaceae bacterium]|nr:3-isopropylmalate dehydratase small subunit [Desulfohalobiaceae bacterium]
MHYTGKAHRVGDHIDTDAIIPARYLVSTDPNELGQYCMAGMSPDWISRVTSGDILVAGANFGCGSSREHAPLALLGAGIPLVIARSFARIFYRNGFNMGLVLMEVGDRADILRDGDRIQADAEEGIIRNLTTEQEIRVRPLPDFMRRILESGGLVPYVRKRLESAA